MPTGTGTDSVLTVTTDPTWAGVKLKADFTALSTKPVRVQFLRGTITVRSGDPAEAPGGLAIAYDHEAPLGVSLTWTAVPLFADGTTGAASAAVTLVNDAMSSAVDCWVKPLVNPGAAVAFEIHNDRIEMGWTSRTQATSVVGRSHPSVAWDRRSPAPVSITPRTATKAAKDALAAALDLGPVLVQLNSVYGIDDFYAVPGDSTEQYFAGMFSPLRDIPTTFTPCSRIPTVDAPLLIPGKSWTQVAATYASWTATAAANASWLTLVGY